MKAESYYYWSSNIQCKVLLTSNEALCILQCKYLVMYWWLIWCRYYILLSIVIGYIVIIVSMAVMYCILLFLIICELW